MNCPIGKPHQVSPGKPWGSKHSCIAVEKPDHQCSNEALMNCGCRFSVVGCVCNHIPPNLPVVQGHLNGSPVYVHKDTGCSGIVHRQDLIRPD